MSGELKHADPGLSLSEAQYIDPTIHVVDSWVAYDTLQLSTAGTIVRVAGAWTTWVPTYGGTGAMTFTSVNLSYAKYKQMGKTVFFAIYFNGTTGGVADVGIMFTLPVTPASAQGMQGGCGIRDTSAYAGSYNIVSGATVAVYRFDGANWGLGAGKYVLVSGTYEAA